MSILQMHFHIITLEKISIILLTSSLTYLGYLD